jgi:aspartate kinase
MKIVQKYGGTSLADAECVRRVARRVISAADNNQVLVVVSAQGDTTDDLVQKMAEITQHPEGREADALLATGEQISAAMLAITLNEMGCRAVSLSAPQVPILAEGAARDGKIRKISTGRIVHEWDDGKVVVVTGFQGVDPDGNIITLGRGGSDTSAVALAAALHADRCQIFTDVDGVYSTDPGKEDRAVRFDNVSFNTMLDLAQRGAKVLHPRAVELAMQYGLTLEVLTSASEDAR